MKENCDGKHSHFIRRSDFTHSVARMAANGAYINEGCGCDYMNFMSELLLLSSPIIFCLKYARGSRNDRVEEHFFLSEEVRKWDLNSRGYFCIYLVMDIASP